MSINSNMTLEQAVNKINEARKNYQLFAPSEREEQYLAEVSRVLLAYGQNRFDAGCEMTVKDLQRGVSVDGFSFKEVRRV